MAELPEKVGALYLGHNRALWLPGVRGRRNLIYTNPRHARNLEGTSLPPRGVAHLGAIDYSTDPARDLGKQGALEFEAVPEAPRTAGPRQIQEGPPSRASKAKLKRRIRAAVQSEQAKGRPRFCFLTLTCPVRGKHVDPAFFKALNAFWQHWRYHNPSLRWVWVAERQKKDGSDTVHIHALCNCYFEMVEVKRVWARALWRAGIKPFTSTGKIAQGAANVQKVKSLKKSAAYLSKYMGKGFVKWRSCHAYSQLATDVRVTVEGSYYLTQRQAVGALFPDGVIPDNVKSFHIEEADAWVWLCDDWEPPPNLVALNAENLGDPAPWCAGVLTENVAKVCRAQVASERGTKAMVMAYAERKGIDPVRVLEVEHLSRMVTSVEDWKDRCAARMRKIRSQRRRMGKVPRLSSQNEL